MLRQPLESGRVTISRAHATVTYPANFLLLAAMNPCPCGYLGSTSHYCTCTPKQIQTYQNRVSGLIQDRIDMILPLHPVNLEGHQSKVDSSSDIKERVQKPRKIQYERTGSMVSNANLSIEEIRKMVILSKEQKTFLQRRASKQNWRNRVQMKMRLARTISDIRGEESVSDEALREAMTLRRTTQLKEEQKKGKWGLG